jgi:hypothetical protein
MTEMNTQRRASGFETNQYLSVASKNVCFLFPKGSHMRKNLLAPMRARELHNYRGQSERYYKGGHPARNDATRSDLNILPQRSKLDFEVDQKRWRCPLYSQERTSSRFCPAISAKSQLRKSKSDS